MNVGRPGGRRNVGRRHRLDVRRRLVDRVGRPREIRLSWLFLHVWVRATTLPKGHGFHGSHSSATSSVIVRAAVNQPSGVLSTRTRPAAMAAQIDAGSASASTTENVVPSWCNRWMSPHPTIGLPWRAAQRTARLVKLSDAV